MKRWNAQTRQWEHKQGNGWVVREAEDTPLDRALGSAFEDLEPAQGAAVGAAPSAAREVAPTGLQGQGSKPASVPVSRPAERVRPGGVDAGPGAGSNGQAAAEPAGSLDLDFDVPGLVSSDGGRGTGGTKSVRERLQKLATRGKAARTVRRIDVGPRAARPTGPAVREGTAQRQQRRKVAVASETPSQRYVNRPAPELLGSRPKWVQELFEAHFRSDMTLGLRKQYNRMKISRQDYAIGWLTLLDKIREEPAIARLKDGQA